MAEQAEVYENNRRVKNRIQIDKWKAFYDNNR